MQIGIVGLGRMGGNIARRLIAHGHDVVAFDRNPAAVGKFAAGGGTGAGELDDLVRRLAPPRAVWVMLPAGSPTEETVGRLSGLLQEGDIVIDGGNSFYKDDIRRARMLQSSGIHYLDVGTSGGIWGYERGYCMMIGGEKEIVARLDPVFAALAPGLGQIARTPHREGRDPRVEHGYMHVGPAGSGHFVKMVHNGIEYGLMQAYAEGFDILKNRNTEMVAADERFDIDLADVAEVWRRGSVISSWLLDLTSMALAENPQLSEFEGEVADSGEGRWTVHAAIEEAVAAPVITSALYARFRSRKEHTFGDRLLSAMRNKFGGHIEQHPAQGKAKA